MSNIWKNLKRLLASIMMNGAEKLYPEAVEDMKSGVEEYLRTRTEAFNRHLQEQSRRDVVTVSARCKADRRELLVSRESLKGKPFVTSSAYLEWLALRRLTDVLMTELLDKELVRYRYFVSEEDENTVYVDAYVDALKPKIPTP